MEYVEIEYIGHLLKSTSKMFTIEPKIVTFHGFLALTSLSHSLMVFDNDVIL